MTAARQVMHENLVWYVAQLVEQRTENPRVAGSIPALGIHFESDN